MVDVEQQAVFAGFIGQMLLVDVRADHLQADHYVVVARHDLLFPDVGAFQVHEAFLHHRRVHPRRFFGGQPGGGELVRVEPVVFDGGHARVQPFRRHEVCDGGLFFLERSVQMPALVHACQDQIIPAAVIRAGERGPGLQAGVGQAVGFVGRHQEYGRRHVHHEFLPAKAPGPGGFRVGALERRGHFPICVFHGEPPPFI